ncbi:MAG: NAD(P)-dependent alcohol dehydrogenase [Saprospiraceae bacterium]|nr:NAD(P)-dependent alcohol dehydrogenase [Saprospiraceae bacterium]
MKAATYKHYGPPEVLQIKEIEKPKPKDNEVLIRMQATAVCSGDVRLRKPEPPILARLMNGLISPKQPILGMEIAGVIEAIGKKVTQFRVGDDVMGSTNSYGGTYAEYICIPSDGVLAIKPDSLSFQEAAVVFFGGHTALHFLRKGRIQKGDHLLIYGASGSLGTSAVQLAKYFGAEVTAVCSGGNAKLVRSLGADHVIDYTQQDFTKNGMIYDIIFDTQGKSPFWGSIRSLKKGGYYLQSVAINFHRIINGLIANITSGRKIVGGVAHERREDLVFLRDLVIAGKLKPVIDRIYPLDQIVAAHRYVEGGHKRGNVVVSIIPSEIGSSKLNRKNEVE